jgi:hypothetical protein
MGINMVTAVANTTAQIILFALEGWKAIEMLIVKIVQLGLATAAFILHTAVTIAQTVATTAITAATWLLNAALAVLTSPIFLVVAAIVALIAIGYLLITNWDKVKAFGQSMINFLVSKFWEFVGTLRNIGGSIFDAIKRPFEDAWNTIQNIMNKIKDALDFTKRHSPSILDIVKKGIGNVNDALSELAWNTNITPQAAALSVANGGQSTRINQIAIDMAGAYIGSEYEASRLGEKMGDAIIKKLQLNIRI